MRWITILLLAAITCFGQVPLGKNPSYQASLTKAPAAGGGGDICSSSAKPAIYATNGAVGLTTSSLSFTINGGPSGYCRAMLAAVATSDTGTISAMTTGGNAMTLIAMTNWFSGKMWLYSYTGQAAGNQTVQVTFSGAQSEAVLTAISLTNVNQTTAFGTPVMDRSVEGSGTGYVTGSPGSSTSDTVYAVLLYYTEFITHNIDQGQTVVLNALHTGGNSSLKWTDKAGAASSTYNAFTNQTSFAELSMQAVAAKGP